MDSPLPLPRSPVDATFNTSPPRIWSGQLAHLALLALSLALLYNAWESLGRPCPEVFWIAAACPILHQVFTWLSWRCELRWSATTKVIGFHGYLVIFFLLFGSRFASLLALAWLDSGSLRLGFVLQVVITTGTSVIGAYATYSVIRYFGFIRAAGVDHFDSTYRDRPLVKKGVFRFTNNGMYTCAFLLFWAIAIAFDSSAALAIAAFSHAYIWVHFYTTEKPDMAYLYS